MDAPNLQRKLLECGCEVKERHARIFQILKENIYTQSPRYGKLFMASICMVTTSRPDLTS